jgi:membrane-associated phospholipid phosphatase
LPIAATVKPRDRNTAPFVVAVFLTVALVSAVARAESARAEPLEWDDSFGRVGTADIIVLGASMSVLGTALFLGPDPNAPVLDRLSFDEAARDVLRARGERGRLFARDASDVLVAAMVSYPVLVEGIANAGFARHSPDAAEQLVLIDIEAQLFAATLTQVGKTWTSRQRPFARRCGADLSADNYDCLENARYYSFPSGHASGSFAAATVVCVQNQYLPLWPRPWLPCAVGYTAATMTAGLRIVADRHYVSDTVAGALVGTGAGLLLPWLHFNGLLGTTGASSSLALVPSPGGFTVLGVF